MRSGTRGSTDQAIISRSDTVCTRRHPLERQAPIRNKNAGRAPWIRKRSQYPCVRARRLRDERIASRDRETHAALTVAGPWPGPEPRAAQVRPRPSIRRLFSAARHRRNRVDGRSSWDSLLRSCSRPCIGCLGDRACFQLSRAVAISPPDAWCAFLPCLASGFSTDRLPVTPHNARPPGLQLP